MSDLEAKRYSRISGAVQVVKSFISKSCAFYHHHIVAHSDTLTPLFATALGYHST